MPKETEPNEEILDKDELQSLPASRKSGLTSMAQKLEKLLAGDDSADKPDEGGAAEPASPVVAPQKPSAEKSEDQSPGKEPEPKTEPKPAVPALKTVSGLKTDQPEEGTAKDDETPSFDVADDEVPATIKSPKAADDFKKIKRSLKETQHKLGLAEKILKDRESQIELLKGKTAPAPGPTQEAYDAISKERSDLLERLETVALERSPQFQTKYKTAFDGAIARAKSVVGDDHAQQIEALMMLPPSKYRNTQIEEIRKNIESGLDQGQLDIAVHEIDRARSEMDAALSNHRTTFSALTEEQKRKETAQKEAMAQRVLEMEKKAIELAQKSSAFEMSDGNPEHNALAAKRIENVKRFIRGEVAEDEIVHAAVLAQENLFLTGEYIPHLMKALKDMESEIKARKGVEPTTAGSTSGKKMQSKQAKGFADRFMAEYQEPPT